MKEYEWKAQELVALLEGYPRYALPKGLTDAEYAAMDRERYDPGGLLPVGFFNFPRDPDYPEYHHPDYPLRGGPVRKGDNPRYKGKVIYGKDGKVLMPGPGERIIFYVGRAPFVRRVRQSRNGESRNGESRKTLCPEELEKRRIFCRVRCLIAGSVQGNVGKKLERKRIIRNRRIATGEKKVKHVQYGGDWTAVWRWRSWRKKVFDTGAIRSRYRAWLKPTSTKERNFLPHLVNGFSARIMLLGFVLSRGSVSVQDALLFFGREIYSDFFSILVHWRKRDCYVLKLAREWAEVLSVFIWQQKKGFVCGDY